MPDSSLEYQKNKYPVLLDYYRARIRLHLCPEGTK